MKESQYNSDDLLKTLIRKSGIESPSHNFSKRVMEEISAAGHKSTIKKGLTWNFRTWYLIIPLGIAAIIYSVNFLVKNQSEVLSVDYNPMLMPVFRKMIQSIIELLPSFKISSFTLIILLAILCLFIIDRLLQKFPFKKNILSLL